MKYAIIGLAFALAACGPSSTSATGDGGPGGEGGPTGQPHELVAISVTPTNPIVELDLNMAGQQAFAATGNYADGVDEDLTDRVAWSAINPAVGTFTTSALDIPARAMTGVDTSRIHAELDGVVGEAQVTVVAYRRSGATQDFFFVLPYQDVTGEASKPLEFGTAVPALDVFFNTDTTGSMRNAINNLRNSLSNTIIPAIKAAVIDSRFGVGCFEDFPTSPWGVAASDQPFRLFQTITDNVAAVQAATASYLSGGNPRGNGLDIPESGIEALYQVATGAGVSGGGASVPANTSGVGGVGYRASSMPVVVTVSDANFHAPGEPNNCPNNTTAYNGAVGAVAHTRAATKTALANICARSVGVSNAGTNAGGCGSQGDLEDFATSTGARVPPAAWDVGTRPAGCAANKCCTGIGGVGRAPDANGLCPLVFLTDTSGNGLGSSVVTGIQMLTRFAQFDVTSDRVGLTTDVDGVALAAPHTTAEFIKAVTPTGFTLPAAPPVVPNPTFDTTAFHGVTPTTKVKFDVKAFNDFVPATANAQIFKATIKVLASGCTALDQREVLILVPPMPITIGKR